MRETQRKRAWRSPSMAEYELLLARLLELPEAQQLRVYEGLTEALGGRLGQETEREKLAGQRAEAMKAMKQAAEYLGLPSGKAPKVAQFKRAARETELSMGFKAVYEAFDGMWELAMRCYEELPIRLNAAQRAVMREIHRGSSKHLQAALVGLRMWLDESPPNTGLTPTDYEDWAREKNEKPAPGSRRLLEKASTISAHLWIPWSYAVPVAKREMTLEDAQKIYADEQLKVAGVIVPLEIAAYLMGLPTGDRNIDRPGYPRYTALIHGKPHWLLSDIHAYQNGTRDFRHGPGIFQRSYMDALEVAKSIGVSRNHLRVLLREANGKYWQVPKPAGLTKNQPYWLRSDVARWMKARDERQADRVRTLTALKRTPHRRKRQY
jgi:predicted DNA-binding transcriptional regulator AlpA